MCRRGCAWGRPSPWREPLAGSNSSAAWSRCGHGSRDYRTEDRGRKLYKPSPSLETLLVLFYVASVPCRLWPCGSLPGAGLAVQALGELSNLGFENFFARAVDHQAV